MNSPRLTAMACVVVVVSLLPQSDQLARLRWLSGCWERVHGTSRTVEMWMEPSGGLMLGASRTVSGATLREWEQLRLSVQGGKVVYTALPSGQNETDFTAVTVTDSGFTVENPAHDFPQRIIYARRGADSLLARIEGKTPQGMHGIDFAMRRTRCEAR